MLDSIKLKTESSIISAKVFAQMFCEVPQVTFELKMKYDLLSCRRQHLILDHLLNTKLPVGNNKKKKTCYEPWGHNIKQANHIKNLQLFVSLILYPEPRSIYIFFC